MSEMSEFRYKQQARVEKLCTDSLAILVTRTENEVKSLVADFEQFWNE